VRIMIIIMSSPDWRSRGMARGCLQWDGTGAICGRPLGNEEGVGHGYEQLYIVTFPSEAHRLYLVGRPLTQNYDPLHDLFKQQVGPFLAVPPVPNGVFVFWTIPAPDNCTRTRTIAPTPACVSNHF
jgi:hypothetical protein